MSKYDIDELAFRYLNRDYSYRGIMNKFGGKAASDAVSKMASVILLCDPDNIRAKRWVGALKRANG